VTRVDRAETADVVLDRKQVGAEKAGVLRARVLIVPFWRGQAFERVIDDQLPTHDGAGKREVCAGAAKKASALDHSALDLSRNLEELDRDREMRFVRRRRVDVPNGAQHPPRQTHPARPAEAVAGVDPWIEKQVQHRRGERHHLPQALQARRDLSVQELASTPETQAESHAARYKRQLARGG
jgi:hypothetical protein